LLKGSAFRSAYRLLTHAARRLGIRSLPGFVLAAILATGFCCSVDALFFANERIAGDDVSWRAFADGRMTADLSQILKDHIPFSGELVAADRVIGWLVAGDLGPRVREGCAGWLFLTDELEIHRDDTPFRFRMSIIASVARFLRHRGIALLIVPVPDKSRVEAARRCGIRRSARLAGRLDRFTAALRQQNIDFADVYAAMAALKGERYYRTDTHWNERGAKRAAEAIAARLHDLNLAPAAQGTFRVTIASVRERVGDLIHLAGLDHVPWPLRPRGDLEAPSRIEHVWPQEVGPFDDLPPPAAVVIGTSFSRRANFTQFLSLALGAPVANMAKDGGGLLTAAVAYFSNAAFVRSPPRVVIWEIPERILDDPIAPAEQTEAATLGSMLSASPRGAAVSGGRR
jgi:alginate O-acetyltransferase complex protein AlgJ